MSSIKIAILIFYYRIFQSSQRFHIAVWVMASVIVCWYLTSALVGCFQCYPARYLWDRTIPGGSCIPENALWIGSSVSSLLTDAAILCLPMPLIWKLRVTWRQRLAISGLFLLGGLFVDLIPLHSVLECKMVTNIIQCLRDIDPSIDHYPSTVH